MKEYKIQKHFYCYDNFVLMTMPRILIISVIISILIMSVSGNNSVEIERVMAVYAIASRYDLLEGTSECRRHLEIFKNAVETKTFWSLRMMDASGIPNSGFINGNGFWLGIKSQCYDIMNTKPLALNPKTLKNNSLYRKPEDEFAPFKLNYFSAHFSHNSTLQYQHGLPIEGLVTLGLCLPASCNTNELSVILMRISNERTLLISSIYDMDISLLNVMELNIDNNFLINWRLILIISFIIFTAIMIIAGTWYDMCIYQNRIQRGIQSNNNNDSQEMKMEKNTIIGSVLMCFSAHTNSKNIFYVTSDGGPTACLHGLRVTGMLLLIAFHVMIYTLDHVDNINKVIRLSMILPTQILSVGAFPVDTFFFMSGFLVAYLFFKNQMKEKNDIMEKLTFRHFFEPVIKRFWRLTPIYIVTIGITEILAGYFAQVSTIQRYEKPQEQCAKYWWRNLLYIHNFFSYEEMCLTWTWYLSDDMQFFIVATTVLILSTRYLHVAMGTVFTMLISSIIITGYTAYEYDYVPTLDEYLPTLGLLYFPPWARIGPYLVGLATGYLIIKLKNKLRFNRITVWIFWIISIVSLTLVQFGLYEKRISVLAASVYAAISRTAWSIAIAWIVIACYTNNAGIVNRILAWKLWLPLSKLTYAAYLLNPTIISSINSLNETVVHLSVLSIVIPWIGYVVITYSCSYVMSLMFEMPYTLLTKLYFDNRKK